MLGVPPRESLLASAEAGEIAAAGRATVRRSAQTQQHTRPAGGVIILLAPGGEFLAIAPRAARIFPCAVLPHTGFPARVAAPAPQRILADQSAKLLPNPVAVRNAYIAGTALRASKLHSPNPRSIITNASNSGNGLSPRGGVCFHARGKSLLQPVANGMTRVDMEALDRRHRQQLARRGGDEHFIG
jgi:hypothetical protein